MAKLAPILRSIVALPIGLIVGCVVYLCLRWSLSLMASSNESMVGMALVLFPTAAFAIVSALVTPEEICEARITFALTGAYSFIAFSVVSVYPGNNPISIFDALFGVFLGRFLGIGCFGIIVSWEKPWWRDSGGSTA